MVKGNIQLAEPVVSVTMPAYNAERFIETAVRSVIDQSFADWELLVIDDGSRDGTCEIVQRLACEDQRIHLIQNEQNMGVAKTRNRGFDLCKGRYVALLDSDDVWHADKLEKQLSVLERQNADFSYCSYAIVDAYGNKVNRDYIVPEQVSFDRLLGENVIGCSTVLLRRELVQANHFETDYFHEDYALWLRLLSSGYKAVGCPEPLVDWRMIEGSRSFDKRKAAMNRWKIYRDYLKLPLLKSAKVFMSYVAASLRKYSAIASW